MAYVKLSDVQQTDTLNDNDSLIVIQDDDVKQIPNITFNEKIKENIAEAIEENNIKIDTSVNEKIQVAKEEQKEYTDTVNQKILSKVGTGKLSTKVHSLINHPDSTQSVYSLNDLTFAPVGTIVYQDKDCTIEYGKITYNMLGTIRIDTDTSISWALNGSEDYVSDKRIATEAGVENYIKEFLSEHLEVMSQQDVLNMVIDSNIITPLIEDYENTILTDENNNLLIL